MSVRFVAFNFGIANGYHPFYVAAQSRDTARLGQLVTDATSAALKGAQITVESFQLQLRPMVGESGSPYEGYDLTLQCRAESMDDSTLLQRLVDAKAPRYEGDRGVRFNVGTGILISDNFVTPDTKRPRRDE